jgi:hypothetical protein
MSLFCEKTQIKLSCVFSTNNDESCRKFASRCGKSGTHVVLDLFPTKSGEINETAYEMIQGKNIKAYVKIETRQSQQIQ